jgi:hypothetical protein
MTTSPVNRRRWPKSYESAPSTTNLFESHTLRNAPSNDAVLGDTSSSLGFVPGSNYGNVVSDIGNNRAHPHHATVSGPSLENLPNILSPIGYNSIYGQNINGPELPVIAVGSSFTSTQHMPDDAAENTPIYPLMHEFKHGSTDPPKKNGLRNSGLLPRNNLKARSSRAPKLAEVNGIRKTKKMQGSGGMSRLLKALNLLEQLKDVLKADDSCAMPISQLEELIGQTLIQETRASRASLTSQNYDWDIVSDEHSALTSSTCGDSTSNSNLSIYSQNDSSMTFLTSDQSPGDLDSMDMRMDMETPRAHISSSIVYQYTFLLNGERCIFSAKSQVDWVKHEESEKHYPQKRYMCIMCIDLIEDEEGNSLCAFCFAQLPAVGNNKTHYL